jgi:hypothetical protein
VGAPAAGLEAGRAAQRGALRGGRAQPAHHAQQAVYLRRKPWGHGKRFALPWAEEERSASYFVRSAAGACPEELARAPALYWPLPGAAQTPQPATPWPPVDAAGFLSLQELGAVPADISALLPAAR